MRRGQRVELGGHIDGLSKALEALRGRMAFGSDALGLAGLLQQAPALGKGRFGVGPSVSCTRHGVAVAFELGERQLALLQGDRGLFDCLLSDLQPPRFAVAARVQVVECLVERLPGPTRTAVGTADRGLEPVAQGAVIP